MVNVDHPEDAVRHGGNAEKNCQRQQHRLWNTRKGLHDSVFESKGAEVQPNLVSGLAPVKTRTDRRGRRQNYDDYATRSLRSRSIMRGYDCTAKWFMESLTCSPPSPNRSSTPVGVKAFRAEGVQTPKLLEKGRLERPLIHQSDRSAPPRYYR